MSRMAMRAFKAVEEIDSKLEPQFEDEAELQHEQEHRWPCPSRSHWQQSQVGERRRRVACLERGLMSALMVRDLSSWPPRLTSACDLRATRDISAHSGSASGPPPPSPIRSPPRPTSRCHAMP